MVSILIARKYIFISSGLQLIALACLFFFFGTLKIAYADPNDPSAADACEWFMGPHYIIKNENDFKIINGLRSNDAATRAQSYLQTISLRLDDSKWIAYQILQYEFYLPEDLFETLNQPFNLDETQKFFLAYKNAKNSLYRELKTKGYPVKRPQTYITPTAYDLAMKHLGFYLDFGNYENIINWIKHGAPDLVQQLDHPQQIASLIHTVNLLQEYLTLYHVTGPRDGPHYQFLTLNTRAPGRSTSPEEGRRQFMRSISSGLLNSLSSLQSLNPNAANLGLQKLKAFLDTEMAAQDLETAIESYSVNPQTQHVTSFGSLFIRFANAHIRQQEALSIPYRYEVFEMKAVDIRLKQLIHAQAVEAAPLMHLNPEFYPDKTQTEVAFKIDSYYMNDALRTGIVRFLSRPEAEIAHTREFKFLQILAAFFNSIQARDLLEAFPQEFYTAIEVELSAIL